MTGISAFRELIRNPADPLNGPLFQMCAEHAFHKKIARDFKAHSEDSRLLAERPRLNVKTVSIEAMAVLPKETEEEYVCTRFREAHDVLLVVTGYGTDDVGEVELQCFNLGNLPWGMIPIITILGTFVIGALGRLERFGGLGVVLKRMRAAYRRGRASRSLGSVIVGRPVADARP